MMNGSLVHDKWSLAYQGLSHFTHFSTNNSHAAFYDLLSQIQTGGDLLTEQVCGPARRHRVFLPITPLSLPYCIVHHEVVSLDPSLDDSISNVLPLVAFPHPYAHARVPCLLRVSQLQNARHLLHRDATVALRHLHQRDANHRVVQSAYHPLSATCLDTIRRSPSSWKHVCLRCTTSRNAARFPRITTHARSR